MDLPRRIDRRASDRIVSWVLDHEKRAASFEEMIQELGQRLLAEGVPVWRLSSSLWAYQPEVAVRNATWLADENRVAVFDVTPERLAGSAYLDSPLVVSRDQDRSLYISLEGDEESVYPVCRDLKGKGATAYWVHAMPVSVGTFVSITTRQPGGFTDEEQGLFEAILPALTLRIELFCSRWGMQSLLHLYLGANAAKLVLDGEFRLGGGREIDAVIWLCDLRGFTHMTEVNPIETVLDNLNCYFKCVVEPIEARGGEVLKFVGDAVLAVFPIAERHAPDICNQAIEAARSAFLGMAALNAERAEGNRLHFGLGLHLGRVSYGNIGTTGRLDFTVIGPAVNETARIESLCASLERPFLVSKEFADTAGCQELESLGTQKLKGVAEAREVFTMPCVYEAYLDG